MPKPSPKPFRPKSGIQSPDWHDPNETSKKWKYNPKWSIVIGGVLAFLYLYFVVFGMRI